MNVIAVTLTNNKRYTKVDEYEALLTEKESIIKEVEYEERLIDYDKDYKSYDPYLDWNGLETSY